MESPASRVMILPLTRMRSADASAGGDCACVEADKKKRSASVQAGSAAIRNEELETGIILFTFEIAGSLSNRREMQTGKTENSV